MKPYTKKKTHTDWRVKDDDTATYSHKNATQPAHAGGIKVNLVKNSKEVYKANRVSAYVPLIP